MHVLIIDRKPLFRDSLAALVRSCLGGLEVAVAATIAEGTPLMGRFPPGLLILEAEQAAGGPLLAAIRLIHPGWRIALLGGPVPATPVDGHFSDDADSRTVIAEVRRLLGPAASAPAGNGSTAPATDMTAGLRAAAAAGGGRNIPRLTRRQQDVLTLLAQGQSTKDIARALDLGVGTIKAHLDGLYRSLGVHSRIAAVSRAQELARAAPEPADAAAASNVIRLDTRAGQRTPARPAPAHPSLATR